MTPSMLYGGLLTLQAGDRDTAASLALIVEFERAAMARALRWAAHHPRHSQDYYWPDSRLEELGSAVANEEEVVT